LAKYDLSKFNPRATPERTPAWWDIVNANRMGEDADLADCLDKLGNPKAVTLDMIRDVAIGFNHDFYLWLKDRKNRRLIMHRLENCNFVRITNPDAEDGLFKIGDKRQAIYGHKGWSTKDQLEAAQQLCRTPPKKKEVPF
jgi:hypothetical protein